MVKTPVASSAILAAVRAVSRKSSARCKEQPCKSPSANKIDTIKKPEIDLQRLDSLVMLLLVQLLVPEFKIPGDVMAAVNTAVYQPIEIRIGPLRMSRKLGLEFIFALDVE